MSSLIPEHGAVVENLHGNLEAAPFEPLFGVGTKARNIKLFAAPRRIAVEGSLQFVLEIVDYDLLDAPVNSAILVLKIRFVGKEISKQGAKTLVDVAGSVKTAYNLLISGSPLDIGTCSSLMLTARRNYFSS